ncbi:hypothetical protein V8F20_000161 [Naviculisporaceae sp. PSN 640]
MLQRLFWKERDAFSFNRTMPREEGQRVNGRSSCRETHGSPWGSHPRVYGLCRFSTMTRYGDAHLWLWYLWSRPHGGQSASVVYGLWTVDFEAPNREVRQVGGAVHGNHAAESTGSRLGEDAVSSCPSDLGKVSPLGEGFNPRNRLGPSHDEPLSGQNPARSTSHRSVSATLRFTLDSQWNSVCLPNAGSRECFTAEFRPIPSSNAAQKGSPALFQGLRASRYITESNPR